MNSDHSNHSDDQLVAGVQVDAVDETTLSANSNPINTSRWAALAAAVLHAEGVSCGELGLRFVDLEAMAELNQIHMGESGPTDVLAFPIDAKPSKPLREHDWQAKHVQAAAVTTVVTAAADVGQALSGRIADSVTLLGDVVICPVYATQTLHQAQAHNPAAERSFDDEVALLVVHGVLHVLGYDHAHPDEASLMQAQQDRLLTAHHRQGYTTGRELLGCDG